MFDPLFRFLGQNVLRKSHVVCIYDYLLYPGWARVDIYIYIYIF